MKLKDIIGGTILLLMWVFLFFLGWVAFAVIINAQPAEDTLITFTDGADLQRQVAEIRAVCDTISGKWVNDSTYRTYFPPMTRCRVNVTIQWFINPSLKAEAGLHVVNIANPIPYIKVPGEALITWEWE